MLTPKQMFRAIDHNGNIGMLFVMINKYGVDGKVYWRPDDENIIPMDEYIEDMDSWSDSSVINKLIILKEIKISKGTKKINVMQASLHASPFLKPGRNG